MANGAIDTQGPSGLNGLECSKRLASKNPIYIYL